MKHFLQTLLVCIACALLAIFLGTAAKAGPFIESEVAGVQIFDRSLTAAEVQSLYETGELPKVCAKCPGGVCPLPAAKQVVRAAEQSVVTATHRLPRAACHPTCQCRETRCQPKRACGVVRRVVCRVRGR